jgi:peptidoglycan/xylan/chitin deacetylase (PgdA/CDA1 family)
LEKILFTRLFAFLPLPCRTHPDIALLSPQALNDELSKIENALKKILGIKPKFFRPPYGSFNQAALDVLESRGYSSEF